MSSKLDMLKAAFSDTEKRDNDSRPNNYYRFWDMKDGEQAVIRFLPDANENNPMLFVVEKRTHNLPIDGNTQSVPCPTMYGEKCPVCEVSSAFYKAEDKVNGKKYWRKKQHIAQAIIVEDPLPPNPDTGENNEGKVRIVTLGYQLFNVIKESFESGELDEVPFAYKGGTDFIIKKSKQGDYSTYALGSRFARKSRDLTEDEIALAQEQMIDLSTLLPQPLPEEKLQAMLDASLNGGSVASVANASTSTSSIAESTPSVETTDDVTTSTVSSDTDADEEADAILQAIRNRRQARAE